MRPAALLTLALAGLFVVWDGHRPPAKQFAAHIMLAVIDSWQAVSPALPLRGRCLFTPTCSVYGELAVRRYGGYRGAWLALKRIFRCSPWGAAGEDWL